MSDPLLERWEREEPDRDLQIGPWTLYHQWDTWTIYCGPYAIKNGDGARRDCVAAYRALTRSAYLDGARELADVIQSRLGYQETLADRVEAALKAMEAE